MKILIDIGHPAHVHYFKNFIWKMRNKGHKLFVSARDRYPVNELLKAYNIKYFNRGKGGKRKCGKLLYLFKADYKLLLLSRKIKPDIFLCFGAVYLTHVAKLMRSPSIFIDDTDHARLNQKFYLPFAKTILTPNTFFHDFGEKHIRFNGYMELCYLHPNYYAPDSSILDLLGVKKDEKYIIMRFVSWNASHDVGHSGISLGMKRKAVKELSKYAKVFISSEGALPEDLKKYQIRIPPEKMHDALYYSSMLYGESATMASECACLGVPSVFVDNNGRGYTDEQEKKYKLVFNFNESIEGQERSVKKAIELLNTSNLKSRCLELNQRLLSDKIDVTAFMIWFIENYPVSVKIMKKNPDFQYSFR